MRYFWINYVANGVTGSCSMRVDKFLNHREFKKSLLEIYPDLIEPHIMSWVEMTEEEYELFTE